VPSGPAPAPSGGSRPWYGWLLWLAGPVGFLLGVLVMFFGQGERVRTVTLPAASTPTVTATATETKQVAPQSCLEALDAADQGFTIAGQAFQAASAVDTSSLKKATDQLSTVAPKYNASKAECRSAAK
jgi:hypothetical protein